MFFKHIYSIFILELVRHFTSRLSLLFMFSFLLLTTSLSFYMGNILEIGEANLYPFFYFFPFLFCLFLPALSMNMWGDSIQNGTVDVLKTLPIALIYSVLGNFISLWAFMLVTLCGSFFMWITINFLGDPDNSIILFSYLSSFLLAGSLLSICSSISAYHKNPVTALLLSCLVCILLTILGLPVISQTLAVWLPNNIIDIFQQFSILTHFENNIKGKITANSIIYYLSLIWLGILLTIFRLKKI